MQSVVENEVDIVSSMKGGGLHIQERGTVNWIDH